MKICTSNVFIVGLKYGIPNNTANQGVQAVILVTTVIDLTRFMKKEVMYNDSSPAPTNEDVYFAVGTSFVNGLLLVVLAPAV